MNDYTPAPDKKKCSKCGIDLPATTEYFYRDKTKKDGLYSSCRACFIASVDLKRRAEYDKKRYWDNRDHELERNRKYKKEHPAPVKGRVVLTDEQKKQYKHDWYMAHKELSKARAKRHYETHRELCAEQSREYRKSHQQQIRDQKRIDKQNRRTRILLLPSNFTRRDWQRAVEYFHGCCAVCGRPLKDLFGTHTGAADHWIAVTDNRTDNPGTVPENMLPLCHGQNGCNLSKGNKDPIEWLIEKYGKRKANQILKRITTYFEWVKTGV
jgi:hypothetical protein